MLEKDPNKRITIQEIREHPWTTNEGKEMLISSEENCNRDDNVTDEEVSKALKPAMSFFTKV
jgi:[calcium/calmodulin-dependent protein kinase] kinase